MTAIEKICGTMNSNFFFFFAVISKFWNLNRSMTSLVWAEAIKSDLKVAEIQVDCKASYKQQDLNW
jgi:hypothetical protein